MASLPQGYVAETAFGVWFLRTHVWEHHVLRVAINDLQQLMPPCALESPSILDVGCGQGISFRLLQDAFRPQRLVGVDVHRESLEAARLSADRLDTPVELIRADLTSIPMADRSVEMVFCHQTFHHLVDQERALAEFWRVLKPGGVLLFAESTDAYIKSWLIRLLFRHPMEVQKSAAGYLEMLRSAGFEFASTNVSYPYLWWSRAKDFGLFERLGLYKPPPPGERCETLVNVVATKRV